jgi:hypothetical protein
MVVLFLDWMRYYQIFIQRRLARDHLLVRILSRARERDILIKVEVADEADQRHVCIEQEVVNLLNLLEP